MSLPTSVSALSDILGPLLKRMFEDLPDAEAIVIRATYSGLVQVDIADGDACSGSGWATNWRVALAALEANSNRQSVAEKAAK